MMTKALLLSVLVGTATSVVSAGSIHIDQIGGGITINSGPMGPAVFGNDQTTWTNSSLAAANSFLNTSGVATNMKITIVAADTTHGLSLMALIDQRVNTVGAEELGHVGMVSVGHGDNLAYLNAAGGNITVGPNSPGGSRTASGNFVWNMHGGGNGFAWANLLQGNTMTFRFNKIVGQALGLQENPTFQFATWTGNGWSVVPLPTNQVSFTASNDWGFSSTVLSGTTSIPLPSTVGMASASLLGLPLIRRRRAK
jgi:hypothetical protein